MKTSIKNNQIKGNEIMNKLLILALLSIFLNAGQSDNNKPKSDEELVAEFMKLDKQVQEEKEKQSKLEQREKESKAKTLKSEAELNTSRKLGKTLDEIGNKLGVDKK